MNKLTGVFNKILVIGILILFVGTVTTPTIVGNNNNNQDTTTITFYTFDKTGTKKCKTELSNDVAEFITDMFEELKKKIINDPISDETQLLKNDFVDIIDDNELIPQKLSKDYITKLLNPSWIQKVRNIALPRLYSNNGSAFFCSIAGEGSGLLFTPIMLPRPRLATIWSSYIGAHTSAVNLYTGYGFVASGTQVGIALGFIGIGLSISLPGLPIVYSFGGYALSAHVKADDIDTYPFN